jgi:putative ABC transport system substrate-binding protein
MHQAPGQTERMEALEGPASQHGVLLIPLPVRTPEDVENVFATQVSDRIDALYVINGIATTRARSRIAELTLLNRLPSIHENSGAVRDGGLMYYGPNAVEQYRRVAYYVDRILKGAKPADLPVEQPMTFDFVVNLNTARELGITFPQEILLQVTEVVQ